jgi:hypothetical protein
MVAWRCDFRFKRDVTGTPGEGNLRWLSRFSEGVTEGAMSIVEWSMVEWVAAVQAAVPSGPGGETNNNPLTAGYFVVCLFAVVLGLAVWVFIRTSARRSSK